MGRLPSVEKPSPGDVGKVWFARKLKVDLTRSLKVDLPRPQFDKKVKVTRPIY